MLGVTVPAVQVSDVPTNETAESISFATASLLHLQPWQVGLLRADNTAVSPRVPLSSLVMDGEVQLKVIPHHRVGGDRVPSVQGWASELPEGPLADFAFGAKCPPVEPMEQQCEDEQPPEPQPPPDPRPQQPELPPPLHPPHEGRRAMARTIIHGTLYEIQSWHGNRA